MAEISIGAVGAALIAGLVSILGLIIGKEQKVSEFRQKWIDDLRTCLVAYVVNLNAISDVVRLRRAGKDIDKEGLLKSYRALNEASHGIKFRINPNEKSSRSLLDSMDKFEKLASTDSDLTPDNIKEIEKLYDVSARDLLKFEWRRVKRGETAFVWTKWLVGGAVVLCALYLFFQPMNEKEAKLGNPEFMYVLSDGCYWQLPRTTSDTRLIRQGDPMALCTEQLTAFV